jgi:putative membrane protein
MTGWQPHPEVWLLVAGVVLLSVWVVRVIGPKVVPAGQPVLRRRQVVFLVAGVLTLWLASDWPVHDIAEERLFSVHMGQHLLLSYVMPPLFLLATPTWLARLVVRPGSRTELWLRRFCRPVVAGLLFNAVVALTHWPVLVNASVESGPLHYLLHVIVVGTALLMWMPVCGPFPEWRLSPLSQMAYLFAMSILPTIPAGWLTFADGAVYSAYDIPERLWGVSVTSDQQAAGLLMKLGGGFYLWTIIATIFFRWYYTEEQREETPTDALLTYDDVEAAFDHAGPAPRERPLTR